MIASVIIPVFNGSESLPTTLESLVSQTTEDFEVIVVDDGSDDDTEKTAKEYCDNYVDFFYIKQEHKGVYAARNLGVQNARGKYVIFLDCGDYFTDDTIEAVGKTADETKADIIFGRCYRYGDIEYEYDRDIDSVVVQRKIGRLETGLNKCTKLGGVALNRKFFTEINISFDESLTAYGEWLLIVQAVMQSKMMAGCPDFILEESVEYLLKDESEFKTPTTENLKSLCLVMDRVYALGKNELINVLGKIDSDESFLLDILRTGLQIMMDDFYRKLWYMDNETLALLGVEFKKYGLMSSGTMLKKFIEKNKEMRIPYMYQSLEEAAKEPLFTIIYDIEPTNNEVFLRSLYGQEYPFFELFVKQSDFDLFPEKFKKMANIKVFDDKTFHYDAHKSASTKNRLDIKSDKPIDRRVLKETCLSKIPSMLVNAVFNQKRSSLGMRKDLKDKGLILKDRDE